MATGPMNSQQTQAANPAADVLRSGERQATQLAALKNPGAKSYKHRFPGAQFIMPDGLALVFAGGVYTTADKNEIAQLDAVVNRPASMIYTEATAAESAKTAEASAADSAANTVAGTDK